MLTSGYISKDGPTDEDIMKYSGIFCDHYATGISVHGSYYLQRDFHPSIVKEVRIGVYMLFGTIPYCNSRELFNYPALVFITVVIKVYPELKQILVDGGTASINAKDSFYYLAVSNTPRLLAIIRYTTILSVNIKLATSLR